MANFVLRLPATSFRGFSISASSNGAVPGTSTRAQNGGPVILELPLDKIRRPLMRTRANDPNKVKELMDSIKEIGLQVPDSRVAIVMKLTSALGSPQFVAKFDAEQKKL
ncbi:sulfiredoxin, chloroplastic/mitochondrial isoform X2 [Populus trichocarpa]|uniref:Sulfiredoxin n=1 Tax=Populus trichocarpa TaxID=3694 RepID=A0A2K1YCN5_POPTR|nr:sulfiredoxin, chloroplastic/mitochondrial isoform X2 [Populus trichocarpa]|eukprot:XP_024437903.1 sulfiredoxin, chloroplastic/mitochondrial isoform X2 [Populus trichocarpa]